MTTKFKRPKRYDATLADEGVTFRIEDECGNYYGDFQCKFLDPLSPKTEAIYKRIRTAHQARIKAKQLSDLEAAKIVFIEAILVNWSGILDEDGEEVTFSKDAANDYFDMDDLEARYVMTKLSELSGNPVNYAVENPAEISKN